ncbi:hypothetical protein J6590_097027, partial [Homalodisca vitripennis]
FIPKTIALFLSSPLPFITWLWSIVNHITTTTSVMFTSRHVIHFSDLLKVTFLSVSSPI